MSEDKKKAQNNIDTRLNDTVGQATDEIVNDSEDLDVSFDDISSDSQDKINKLKHKLRQALKEKEEYLSGWQRCRADFVNAKRATDIDRLGLVDAIGESFIKDILPVLDSFDLALNMDKSRQNGESPDGSSDRIVGATVGTGPDGSSDRIVGATVGTGWRIGFLGIYSKMLDILGKRGLKQIGLIGDKFNVNEQEAVAMTPVDKDDLDDIVTEVLQKGYSLNGRVIRPAKVMIGQYEKLV